MSFHALLDDIPLMGLLLLAAVMDVRRRRIPNWLTFGLIFTGLARAMVLTGPSGLVHALAGLLAGAAVPLVLFVLGALGGGDVKLLAGIGAWLGAAAALAVFAVTCCIGVVLILAQSMIQRRTMLLLRNSAVLAVSLTQRGLVACSGESFSSIDSPVPYAVPVGIATLLVLLGRSWNAW